MKFLIFYKTFYETSLYLKIIWKIAKIPLWRGLYAIIDHDPRRNYDALCAF